MHMRPISAASIAAAIALCAAGTAARAEMMQARAQAIARAVILDASEVSGQRDLAFGDVAPGPVAGSVLIDPVTDARATVGGVTALAGTAHSAAFVAPGTPDRVYIVQLPDAPIRLSNGTGATMTVSDWTSNGPSVRRFDASGIAVVQVGGRLNVGADQPEGTYSGTFEVRIIFQ